MSADPPTVLVLLDRLQKAEEKVARFEELAEASRHAGRGGTWVHDDWFRATLRGDA